MAKIHFEKTNWIFGVSWGRGYIFRVITLLNEIQDKVSDVMGQTVSLSVIYTPEKKIIRNFHAQGADKLNWAKKEISKYNSDYFIIIFHI